MPADIAQAINTTLSSFEAATGNSTFSAFVNDWFSAFKPLLQIYFGNDYFSAGLGFMIISALYNGGITWLQSLQVFITDKLYYHITITSKDEAFTWVEHWISMQQVVNKVHDLKVNCSWEVDDNDEHYDYTVAQLRPTVTFMPAEGSHTFVFENTTLYVSRSSENESSASTGTLSFSETETFTISVFGFNKRAFLQKFIEHCMDKYYVKFDEQLAIYEPASYRSVWYRTCLRETRALESIILDEGVKEAVLEDMTTFLSEGDYYRRCGIPYRRGYLFYGHPGTGKTSFIMALASHFRMSISVLSLSSSGITDEKLNELLNRASTDSIVLLEDIDAAFFNRSSKSDNNLTFAGLLNALDGAATQDKRIIVMTTNHIQNLSPALIRPGRVDMKVKLDLASHSQIERMFHKFYPDTVASDSAQLIGKLLKSMPEKTCSTAQLQCFFMKHRANPEQLLDEVQSFVVECQEEVERHTKEAEAFEKERQQNEKKKKQSA